MSKGERELTRQDSDEWLCSSTYQPSRSEIVGRERMEKRKTRKKKLHVVIPMTNQSIRFERVENGVKRIEGSSKQDVALITQKCSIFPDSSFLKPIDDDINDVTVSSFTSAVICNRKNEIRLETNDSKPPELKFISPILPKRS